MNRDVVKATTGCDLTHPVVSRFLIPYAMLQNYGIAVGGTSEPDFI